MFFPSKARWHFCCSQSHHTWRVTAQLTINSLTTTSAATDGRREDVGSAQGNLPFAIFMNGKPSSTFAVRCPTTTFHLNKCLMISTQRRISSDPNEPKCCEWMSEWDQAGRQAGVETSSSTRLLRLPWGARARHFRRRQTARVKRFVFQWKWKWLACSRESAMTPRWFGFCGGAKWHHDNAEVASRQERILAFLIYLGWWLILFVLIDQNESHFHTG